MSTLKIIFSEKFSLGLHTLHLNARDVVLYISWYGISFLGKQRKIKLVNETFSPKLLLSFKYFLHLIALWHIWCEIHFGLHINFSPRKLSAYTTTCDNAEYSREFDK
jgi:hypothetical protein